MSTEGLSNGANGSDDSQVVSNPNNYPQTTKYNPEDFSQRAINRGQRRINYELNQVDKKLADALKALRDAVARLPGGPLPEIATATQAISEAEEISATVADIIPPGCAGPIPN